MTPSDVTLVIDIYVLTERRSADFVGAFLDRFLPDREEAADDYVVDGGDGLSHVFGDINDAIAFCCAHPKVYHAFYWRNMTEGAVLSAMVFFTTDDALILGLSVADPRLRRILSDALKHFVGAAHCLTTWELPPPTSAAAFKQAINAGASAT